MATHSSILAWSIPWIEDPGGPQSTGSQRVRQDWSDLACTCTHECSLEGALGCPQVRGWSDSSWNWQLNKQESKDRSGWIVRNCRSRGWISRGTGKWKSLEVPVSKGDVWTQHDGNICGEAVGTGWGAVGLELSVVCGNSWVLSAAQLWSPRSRYRQGVGRRAGVSAGDSVRRGREACVLTAGASQGFPAAVEDCGRREPAVTSGSPSCSQRSVRCEKACSLPPTGTARWRAGCILGGKPALRIWAGRGTAGRYDLRNRSPRELGGQVWGGGKWKLRSEGGGQKPLQVSFQVCWALWAFEAEWDAAAAAAKSLQSCPTVQPHRRQPTRLRRPWDSPGKNTGVGCHFLLQRMKVKLLSRVRLCATP